MRRKADPNRVVEARVPTRLGDVVRERERRGATKKKAGAESDTPLYRAPRPAQSHDEDPFDDRRVRRDRGQRNANMDEELSDSLEDGEAQSIEEGRRSHRGERKSRASQKWTPMARAVAMLSRREHSQVELIQKLTAKGVDEEEARKAVEELKALDLQSDERFLESKVRQRVGGGYGPKRALVELSGHGLDEAEVEQAVERPGEAWTQGAYDLIERRYGESPLPFELRQKALGLLVRRGFSFEKAQQVIREPRPDET